MILTIIMVVMLGGPAVITILEVVSLAYAFGGKTMKHAMTVDILGVLLAIAGMFMLMHLDIDYDKAWFEAVYEGHMHAPVAEEHALTVIVLTSIGVLAPLAINAISSRPAPPLIPLILIAATYVGFAMEVLLTCQIGYNLVILVNIFIMDLRTIMNLVRTFRENHPEKKDYRSRLMRGVQNVFYQSSAWPILAILFVLPVAGLAVGILILFGQAPDAAIRAFTETADWKLSELLAPPKVWVDEHYLCTVAAGGHKKVVKPLRKGIRHGHEVTVNRQLQIANAFEQILEERTPKVHRLIRGFYDRYGFPIARLIRTKTAADIVYLLMKPAEWIFLMVLYLCDTDPENRIAMQYTGKSAKDILKQENTARYNKNES